MSYRVSQITHKYGDFVHILDDPLALSLLAKLSRDETRQPEINRLVRTLYHHLVCTVVASELPTVEKAVETRMHALHPEGVWRGTVMDRAAKVVVLCVARAGIFPSQVCYDFLNDIIDPSGVRQDHLLMARTTDEAGHVDGACIQGAKIGGPVGNCTLLIPDPMGATGTTIETLLNHYRKHVPGDPQRIVALNLIVTPEYIRHVRDVCPGTRIYAYRLDRGLSDPDVLAAPPGEHWDKEKGLNENGYIVPGAGGLGEVMNNAFV